IEQIAEGPVRFGMAGVGVIETRSQLVRRGLGISGADFGFARPRDGNLLPLRGRNLLQAGSAQVCRRQPQSNLLCPWGQGAPGGNEGLGAYAFEEVERVCVARARQTCGKRASLQILQGCRPRGPVEWLRDLRGDRFQRGRQRRVPAQIVEQEFPELAHPARDRGVLSLDQCFPDHLVSKRAVVSELLLELARALRGERFARRFAGRRRDLRSEVTVPTILWTPRGEEEETAQHEQHGPDHYCDGDRRRLPPPHAPTPRAPRIVPDRACGAARSPPPARAPRLHAVAAHPPTGPLRPTPRSGSWSTPHE